MNWQPIETAPKDGRPIWVKGNNWGDISKGIHYHWAWWDGSSWRSPGGAEESSEFLYLTYWMPLPPPPGADE